MKGSKVQSSLFSSRKVIKESDAVQSNCCGGIRKQVIQEMDKEENAVDTSKKISCSMLRSKKHIKEGEMTKVMHQKNNQQEKMQSKGQTLFVNNFSIVPPIKSYHHHHYYHIVKPTETPRIQQSRIQSTQQSQNKQMFFSTRTTFPSSKLSPTQNSNIPSFLTPENSGVLNSRIHSFHPLEGLKLRYSQSKNMDYTKQQLRLEESEVMAKFFTPRGSIVLQTRKQGQY